LAGLRGAVAAQLLGWSAYGGGVADVSGTFDLKTLVAQAEAVLLTRGVQVEPVSVRNVVVHLVRVIAAEVGMDEGEAVRLVTAEAVADAIVRAIEAPGGGKAFHAVRPVRLEMRAVTVSLPRAGRLVMAASQAAKYAVVNGDGASAEHLLDLATEIGVALSGVGSAGAAALEVGLLDELAQLLKGISGRIEGAGWSICPCGEDHGQREVDREVVAVMRSDAESALTRRQG
jgi:hypothetical protein